MRNLLLVLVILRSLWLSGQPIDSLRFRLEKSNNLKEKMEIMADLIQAYQRISTDTALSIGYEALSLITHDSLIAQQVRIQTNLGTVYLNRGEYQTADSLFRTALHSALNIKDMKQTAIIYNNFGLSQSNQHNYNVAIEYYLKSAHLSDSLNIMETSIRTLVNIGVIYHYQNNTRASLDYHLKALRKIAQHDLDLGTMQAVILRNTGAFYQLLKMMDSAYYYTNKSLEISLKNNDKRGLSICYQNLGDFIVEENPKDAEPFYLKSLALKRELKNFNGIAHTTASLGNAYLKMKKHHKAHGYFSESLQYAEKLGDLNLLVEIHKLLSKNYEQLGDITNALKHHKLYVESKDSLVARSNEEKILALQTQYETSQKEKQILELKHQQNLNEITIKNNRLIIALSFFAIAIIGFLFVVVSRAFLSIKKKRDILKEKNAIIELQNEEIRTQRDHLSDSNQRIQEQHRQIEDSIDYARQIQESLLPTRAILSAIFGEHLLFFQPKDVVSGDFYWVHQTNRFTYVAVGDCTGHGVPGAFMSVLSISLLNEVVKGNGISNPAAILEEMRRLIISSLKQDGTKMGGTDGLELALCRIDKDTKRLVFAGAQRSLLLLRNEEMEEFSPNKMPVSAHVTMTEFTDQEFVTQSGDVLYMFTDGFQDQFESQNSHRYGKQRLKEFLLTGKHLSLSNQQRALETEFSAWKGDGEQIDDVLVLGLRC